MLWDSLDSDFISVILSWKKRISRHVRLEWPYSVTLRIRLLSRCETITKRSRDWIKLDALTRSHNVRLGMRSFSFFFTFSWLRSSRHRHMATEDYEGTATTVSNFQRYYYFNPPSSARCLSDVTYLTQVNVKTPIQPYVRITFWIFEIKKRSSSEHDMYLK